MNGGQDLTGLKKKRHCFVATLFAIPKITDKTLYGLLHFARNDEKNR
jgi:hypothetical protein